jgi:hypothetical protein
MRYHRRQGQTIPTTPGGIDSIHELREQSFLVAIMPRKVILETSQEVALPFPTDRNVCIRERCFAAEIDVRIDGFQYPFA